MPKSAQNWIVETDWLASHLSSPDLIILDGSWHLPTANRDAKKEYLAEHIPGALFFDIDDLSDEKSSLPHMLPSTVKFASRMKKMGVGDGARIVVYDTTGIFSAARVWWTFRAMGHRDVAVLNGGLRKWKAEGRPLEDGPPAKRSERHYTPLQNTEIIRDLDEMQAQAEAIDFLAELVAEGKTITLLCSSACEDPKHCHRALLKRLIEARVAARGASAGGGLAAGVARQERQPGADAHDEQPRAGREPTGDQSDEPGE